jgi:4-amino-4-deoxy-L-arabinose transferase
VDIPLAASFSLAVLLSRPWTQTGDRRHLPYAAGCLGIAVLAKGGVALVLILPLLWAGRTHWRDLFRPAVWGTFLAAASPWYVLCYLKNGRVFLNTFFWQHQVERFVNDSLQHGQRFWFYLPILLAGIFPWTPLIALIFRPKSWRTCSDLLSLIAFGLLFFSISFNKLPQYLLPLLPSLAAVAGLALADLDDRNAKRILLVCVAFACLSPVLAGILPDALAGGLSRSDMPSLMWLGFLPLALCILFMRRAAALATIAAMVTAATVFLKISALPVIDERVSARPIWRQIASRRERVCVEWMHRRYRYGLNYYSVTPLPDCNASERPLHVVQSGTYPPQLISATKLP